MSQGSKSKPLHRKDVPPSIGGSDIIVSQVPVDASMQAEERGWAKREEDRLNRERNGTQAFLATTCGVRGGR